MYMTSRKGKQKGWTAHWCLPGLDWGENLNTREEREGVVLEAGTVQCLDIHGGYMTLHL